MLIDRALYPNKGVFTIFKLALLKTERMQTKSAGVFSPPQEIPRTLRLTVRDSTLKITCAAPAAINSGYDALKLTFKIA